MGIKTAVIYFSLQKKKKKNTTMMIIIIMMTMGYKDNDEEK